MRSVVGVVFAALVVAAATGCTGTTSPAPPPSEATAPGVDRAQPMRARAAHTATLLADGRVLIVGGCADDGCPTADTAPDSEFYVPGRGFTAGPPMRHPRDGHSATLLADGRVLIAGGFAREGTPPLAEAELFDPATGRFEPTGSLGTGRGAHAAVRLRDGRVLIAGGYVGPRTYTSSVEIFDPATGTFTGGPAMPGVARTGAVGILLADGRVLVIGGQDGPTHGLTSALLYLPDTNRWQPAGSMGTPRFKHAVALLPDGRVLVMGGTTDDTRLLASTEIFDPATNRFTPGPDMGAPRYKFADAVAVTRDGLVVAGGTDIETYDARSRRFRPVPGSRGAVRSFPTVTALPDGSVLVVGGYDDRIRTYDDAFVIPPGG